LNTAQSKFNCVVDTTEVKLGSIAAIIKAKLSVFFDTAKSVSAGSMTLLSFNSAMSTTHLRHDFVTKFRQNLAVSLTPVVPMRTIFNRLSFYIKEQSNLIEARINYHPRPFRQKLENGGLPKETF
jgi:hypothetical protein